MAGVDLDAIRAAIVNQIQTALTGVRPVNGYDYDPGETRQYPAVIARPGEPYVTYHVTFGDGALCTVNLSLEVRTNARNIDEQKALDEFCSAGTGQTASIRAAVEADRTLGGVVGDCCVMVAHQPFDDPDSGDVVVTFDVEIHQRRD